MNENRPAHEVFISYSSVGNDKVIADAVCAKLEEHKIKCWIAPRDVVPGRNYGGAIVDALSQSRVFVLVFSNNANESQQVLREVERAVSKGIPVIPFRIEDVTPSTDMEYFLSATHWLDALTPPVEQHIQLLATTIRTLLDAQGRGEEAVNADAPLQTDEATEPPQTDEAAKLPKSEDVGQSEKPAPAAHLTNEVFAEGIEGRLALNNDDLRIWVAERKSKRSKILLLLLRLLAVALPLVMIYAIATPSSEQYLATGQEASEDVFFNILITLSWLSSPLAAFLLAWRTGFARSWLIIFPILALVTFTLSLIYMVFLKTLPRNALADCKRSEGLYRKPGDSYQKELAMVLARKATVYSHMGKKRDAHMSAREALLISNKYRMTALTGYLNGLLQKLNSGNAADA